MAWAGTAASIVAWLDGFGLLGLAILTFTEAIVQPIPPDILTLPMFLSASGPLDVFAIWLVATTTSVAGALVGYLIGARAGRWVLDRHAPESAIRRIETLVERYGLFGVFIAAVSPIPYKVFAWVAGMGEMDLRAFVAASLLGRGLRFGIQAVAIGLYGDSVIASLTPLNFLLASIVGAALLVPLHRWWRDLDPQAASA